jgi:nitronate monooxygenase
MTSTTFTKLLGIKHPIIGGAMYPCSNPELVAAVSEAGGIGIVQPVSLVFVNRYNFRDGLKKIRTLTKNPIGLNLLIEGSSKTYLKRNQEWLDIALEEGVRFFITALGNPRWVTDRVAQTGGTVFHDVTEEKYAKKAIDGGVHGLICVNNTAGGHAGRISPQDLYSSLKKFNLPLICAGGIGGPVAYKAALAMGYDGVQMGTRMIATKECSAHADYKQAILKAQPADIVLSEKITGVPVSVINTPYIKSVGTKAGPLTKLLLKNNRTKHWMRTFYSLKSVWQLKKSLNQGSDYKEFYQAGKSVGEIKKIDNVKDVIDQMTLTN